MEKQDLKNLLENIYHLLAEEGVPPMLTPTDPNAIPMAPPPPWLSPLDPNPTPRVDPILNPEGPGGGTIRVDNNGRRFYVFPDGRVFLWKDSLDPPRWILFKYPMLGDPSLPWGPVMPWWLGGTHTPEEWLEIINRSPRFRPQWPTNSNQ